MIAKYKKYKFVELEEDEMVLVRLSSKGWKGVPKRHFVVEGKVIKKCERAENYRVSIFRSGETVPIKLWIGIEDISALKKDTNHLTKEWRKCPCWHFLIPLKEWSYWYAQKSRIQGYFWSIRWWKLSVQCNSIFFLFIWFWLQWRSSWLSKNT